LGLCGIPIPGNNLGDVARQPHRVCATNPLRKRWRRLLHQKILDGGTNIAKTNPNKANDDHT